jgi:hypothetical protein
MENNPAIDSPDNGQAPSDAGVAPVTQEVGGQPSAVEGLPNGMTEAQLAKSYKDLQSQFTKVSETNKGTQGIVDQFAAYGGAEAALANLQYLADSEPFAEFVKSQQSQTVYDDLLGPDADDDQKAGIDVVQKLVSKMMDERLSGALDSQVRPLIEAREAEEDAATKAALDGKYPGMLEKYGAAMGEIISQLPENVQNSGDPKVMEGILMMAMSNDPDGFNKFGAQQYQAKLEADKSKSTGAAPSNPNGSPVNAASNIKEAFEAAKRALGTSL